jgi:hypothetical protein
MIVPILMGYLIRGRILPEEKNPVNRFLIWVYRPVLRWAKTPLARPGPCSGDPGLHDCALRTLGIGVHPALE